MICGTFKLGPEQIEVVVRGAELLFRSVETQQITTIEGLRLSKAGVLKEHPDLKNNNEWKVIAIDRLKEHVKKMKTEKERLFYVKGELIKFGYEPLFWQRAGHRPQKFKDEKEKKK